jgi:hypothetical protein
MVGPEIDFAHDHAPRELGNARDLAHLADWEEVGIQVDETRPRQERTTPAKSALAPPAAPAAESPPRAP